MCIRQQHLAVRVSVDDVTEPLLFRRVIKMSISGFDFGGKELERKKKKHPTVLTRMDEKWFEERGKTSHKVFSHNFGRRMSKACERGKPRERKEKRRQKRDLKKGTFTTHPRIRTQTPGGSKAHQFNMSTIVGLLQGYLKHIIKDVCTPSPPLTPHSPPPQSPTFQFPDKRRRSTPG